MGKKGGFILWIMLVVVALIVLGFFTNWFGISGKIIWWGDQDSESVATTTISDQMITDLQSRIVQLEERGRILEASVGLVDGAILTGTGDQTPEERDANIKIICKEKVNCRECCEKIYTPIINSCQSYPTEVERNQCVKSNEKAQLDCQNSC